MTSHKSLIAFQQCERHIYLQHSLPSLATICNPMPRTQQVNRDPCTILLSQVFKDKLRELKKVSRALFKRLKEAVECPKLVATLRGSINISHDFVARMKNLSEAVQIFTEVEINTLETLTNETEVRVEGHKDCCLLSITSEFDLKCIPHSPHIPPPRTHTPHTHHMYHIHTLTHHHTLSHHTPSYTTHTPPTHTPTHIHPHIPTHIHPHTPTHTHTHQPPNTHTHTHTHTALIPHTHRNGLTTWRRSRMRQPSMRNQCYSRMRSRSIHSD